MGDSGPPQWVGRALLGPEAADPSLPAGVTAWRQDHPDEVGPGEGSKDVLVEVVLGVIGRG